MPTPAFVYDIRQGDLAGDILLSLETGHVLSLQNKNPEVVRFCIDAHWNKVFRSEYCQFDDSKLFTVSLDKTWCIWDAKTQKLKQKVKTQESPNTGMTLPSNRVIIADTSPGLKIYDLPN